MKLLGNKNNILIWGKGKEKEDCMLKCGDSGLEINFGKTAIMKISRSPHNLTSFRQKMVQLIN
jgi:hypothetical protein